MDPDPKRIFDKRQIDEMLESFKDCLDYIPPNESPSTIYGWDEQKLHDEAGMIKYPAGRDNIQNIKGIIRRFFTFYFLGDTPSTRPVLSTIMGAVMIGLGTEKDESLNWLIPSEFISSSTDTPFFELSDFPEDIPTAAQLSSMIFLAGASSEVTERQIIFRNLIKELLKLTEIKDKLGNANYPKNFKTLMRLTGFLALTYIRTAGKSCIAVEKAFQDINYTRTLIRLVLLDVWNYAPPAKSSIKEARNVFNMQGLQTTQFFKTLISRYVKVNYTEKDIHIASILSAGCMMHLAMYGLTMVKLIGKACEFLTMDIPMLQSYTMYEDHTAVSWKEYFHFERENFMASKTQYSVYWCRFVNKAYYLSLNAERNWFLCGILTTVCENDVGIWDAKWARGRTELLAVPKSIGRRLTSMQRNKRMKEFEQWWHMFSTKRDSQGQGEEEE